MMQLVFFFQATQDRDRVFNRWFTDKHRLEPSRKRCVFFHMLAIFIQGCRTNTMQFTACQSGLEQIGCIHRPIGFTGTHQSMHFINEQDDITFRRGDFLQHGF